ncbi:protein neuralized isoform X2 [Neocloeon triangulifer]|uniref:protein neuralized isoform X2 n=1 Tax=Neocloeon triangulifer TaxID=2078957 RepID=UPI00286ED37E|nr:protein neuralized isoform X2 [Neocloeon triangulifer]XP_059485619.1 protein neuralized isoform X2 [Neocloeon triangulifer]
MGQSDSSLGCQGSSGGGLVTTNNLPPLTLHSVHGDNVQVSLNGAIARRVESFCKGICFTARPVSINEKVCVKFIEVSDNWSGVIRFGFTSNDPSTLRGNLPKYACPDLTNKVGFWAKALAERYAVRDSILFFYVTSTGDVHFGVDGEEKGIFFTGVETRGPLWALLDLYGNCTAVEIIDSRQLSNSRISLPSSCQADTAVSCSDSIHMSSSSSTSSDIDRILASSMASMRLQQQQVAQPKLQKSPPRVPAAALNPLAFHKLCGRNMRLSYNQCVASRLDSEFCNGYVFTARPLCIGETIVIKVLATEPMYVGALAFGVTSCDPGILKPDCLPDDSDLLLDRPEFWALKKDVASSPLVDTELAFQLHSNGQLTLNVNGGPSSSIMYVDQSLALWAFFDVYGSTQKIKLLGSLGNPVDQPCDVLQHSPDMTGNNLANMRHMQATTVHTAMSPVSHVSPISLVVNLPPCGVFQQYLPAGTTVTQASVNASGTLLSNYSQTYIEPVRTSPVYATLDSATNIRTPGTSGAGWNDANNVTHSECSICYERTIDSVLYMCGHMCMCYECAIQQWRGKGGGHCPLCRAVIRDVIRTYTS